MEEKVLGRVTKVLQEDQQGEEEKYVLEIVYVFVVAAFTSNVVQI